MRVLNCVKYNRTCQTNTILIAEHDINSYMYYICDTKKNTTFTFFSLR